VNRNGWLALVVSCCGSLIYGMLMTIKEMSLPWRHGRLYSILVKETDEKERLVSDDAAANPKSPIERVVRATSGAESLTQSLQHVTDRWAWSFRPIEISLPHWMQDLNRQHAEIAKAATAALRPMASWMTKMTPTFALMQRIETLNKAHWIAHPVLPLGELVGEDADPTEIDRRVATYVEGNRDAIYDVLQTRFSNYKQDDDTKSFAIDLIEAHRR
jgi:hypothetical protein